MADEMYPIPELPAYDPQIRKIQDLDEVSASGVVNPVLSQMITNTHAVKNTADRKQRVCRVVVAPSGAGWTAEDADFLCDGTNDQEEISAAVASLPKEGGEVVLLDGTFNLSDSVIITKTHARITGRGFPLLKAAGNANIAGILMLRGCYYCTVSGLQIDGNSFPGSYGIYFHLSRYCLATDNYITNCSAGIRAGLSPNNRLIGNICTQNQDGLLINDGSGSMVIEGNTLDSNSKNGIYMIAQNTTVTGNQCSYNSGHGIYLNSGNNNTVSANICIFNSLEEAAEKTSCGIYLSGHKNLVTGNNCAQNDCAGILIASGQYNSVTANSCTQNTVAEIDIKNARSSIISSNLCIYDKGFGEDTAQETIILRAGTNNLIINNMLYGKNYTDASGQTSNTFTGNKFDAN